MPNGYETRQGGRQTFASATPAPQQGKSSFSGVSAGAQVIGGQSQGGVVGGNITAPGPVGGQLGEFFGSILEPYVQRQQKEQFLKGAMDQMGRQGNEEIRASSGGFTKIFGPDSFEQGAIFYGAQRAANDFANETMADMDNLKRMPPAEFQKYVAHRMSELETGDPFTDQATQAGIFDNLSALSQTHAKSRYVWGQEEAKRGWTDNMIGKADMLHQSAATLASLSDPSDDESNAFAQLVDNFAVSATPPQGMDEATYKDSVYDLVRGLAQKGNGHAVQVLMSRGLAHVLDEDKAQQLEDQIHKYAQSAMGDAMKDPAIAKRLTELRVMTELGKATPNEVSVAMEGVNQAVRMRTGFDEDVFDWKDKDGGVKSVLSATKAAYDRAESRRWAIEDREDQQQFQIDQKEAEARKAASAISAMYESGNIATAITAGIGSRADYDLKSQQDYNAGNFAALLRNYRVGNFVSTLVAQQAQGKLGQSLGGQYTDATKLAYQEWQQFNKASPALAAAYYGKYHAPLVAFDNMVAGKMAPELAYQHAFKNPARYSGMQMNPQQRKESDAAISASIAGEEPWKWVFTNTQLPFQRRGLNAQSKRLMADALRDQNTILSQNSSLSMDLITAQSTEQMVRNGRLERYGPLLMENAPNTKPLSELLHLKMEDADKVVVGVIDSRLRTAGASSGADGDNVTVRRMLDPKGQPLLFVQSYDEDAAHPVSQSISWEDLWSATQAHINGKVVIGTPSRGPNRVLTKVINENRANIAARDAKKVQSIDLADNIGPSAIQSGVATVFGAVATAPAKMATNLSQRVIKNAKQRQARKKTQKD